MNKCKSSNNKSLVIMERFVLKILLYSFFIYIVIIYFYLLKNQMDKQLIKDFLDYGASSFLLIVILIITKKSWAWGRVLFLVFIWAILCGYFLSWLPATFFPTYYTSGLRSFLNGACSIVWFYAMLYLVDKDTFYEAFDLLKKKQLAKIDNNQ